MIRWLSLILVASVFPIPSAVDVCNQNAIAAFSRQGGLISILGCLENARSVHFLSQSDVNNVVLDCLNDIGALAPTFSLATATQCSACYKALINDLFELIIGIITSGVFAPTTSNLSIDCTTLTTASGVELCLKNSDLRAPLLTFQKCSGFAVIYPSAGTLAVRRSLIRAGIFEDVLRVAFGTGVVLDGILEQVSANVNNPPTPLPILFMQVCYLTLLDDLKETKPALSLSVIADCSSTRPSDVCLSDNLVVNAITRFENCAGFQPGTLPEACSEDVLSKVYGNYDAMAALLPVVILNYESSLTTLLTSVQPVVANIARFGGDNDCAICFQELAVDIAENIQVQKLTLSVDQFAAYIGGCNDPHTSDCGLLIGSSALLNFQECSGSSLDLLASTTKNPVVSPAVTTTSTTTPGSLFPSDDPTVSQKSVERRFLMYSSTFVFGVMLLTIILESHV